MLFVNILKAFWSNWVWNFRIFGLPIQPKALDKLPYTIISREKFYTVSVRLESPFGGAPEIHTYHLRWEDIMDGILVIGNTTYKINSLCFGEEKIIVTAVEMLTEI